MIVLVVRRLKRAAGEDGLSNALNLFIFAGVTVLAVIAALLLLRVTLAARNINDKAAMIAQSGRGIDTATDSVIQLNRTNQTASSILESAAPLDPKLSEVVRLATMIDQVAGSINTSADSINGSATSIGGTAGGINSTAGTILNVAKDINSTAGDIDDTAEDIEGETDDILDVAKRVDKDAKDINDALDTTINLARQIKDDSANILRNARRINRSAACIENKLKVLGVLGDLTNDCPNQGLLSSSSPNKGLLSNNGLLGED